MLDAQKWIEQAFAPWGWRDLGIAALALFGVVLAAEATRAALYAAYLPPLALPAPASPQVVRHWLDREDPRGFLDIPRAGLASMDKAYDVAWISGSAISIRQAPPEWRLDNRPAFDMTEVLARYLKSVGGQPVRVHEYLMQGARTGDLRRVTLNAARRPEIDALIVEINPIWLFNEWLQFTMSRQRAVMFREPGASFSDLSVAARIVRPSELGLQTLGTLLPMVEDRGPLFGRKIWNERIAFPFVKRGTGKVSRDGDMIPFWQKLFYPPGIATDGPEVVQDLRGYRGILFMSNLDPNSMGARIFRDNVRALAATGKPVVLFMPPINPRLKQDPEAVKQVDAIVALVEKLIADVGANNLTVHTSSIWNAPQPFEHRDIYHLKHGQGVIDLVVDLLQKATGKPVERNALSAVYSQPKR